ncbi:MAG: hypothetical protein Q8O67_14695 [Deltaproteobacteria bacterium]|nr:hypothetical protein [Deltaproteobacteria bacterium]
METPKEAPAPEMPSIDQRRMVGLVATGAAVVALTTGVVAGVLAQAQYDCVSDVVSCNKQRDDEIIGAELFAARTDFQTKALYADMGFVAAVVAGLVAVASFVAATEEPAVGAP